VTINRPAARNAQCRSSAVAGEGDRNNGTGSGVVVILTGPRWRVLRRLPTEEISAGRGAGLSTEANGFAGFVFAQRRKPWIAGVTAWHRRGWRDRAACDMIVAADSGCICPAGGQARADRGSAAACSGCARASRHVALELIATGTGSVPAASSSVSSTTGAGGRVRNASLKLAGEVAPMRRSRSRESGRGAQTLDWTTHR